MQTSPFPPMLRLETQCSHGPGKIKLAIVSFTCLVLQSPSKPHHRKLALLQLLPFLLVLISSSSTLAMDAHLWKAKTSTTQIQVQMQMSHAKPQTQVLSPELVVQSMVWPRLVLLQAHRRALLREIPVLQ